MDVSSLLRFAICKKENGKRFPMAIQETNSIVVMIADR